jgi:hypothetical protein
VVLRCTSRPRQPISAGADLFEGTRPRHSGQRASVDSLMSYVAGP